MTEPNGAPSGADVQGASSSATNTPAPTGRPSRGDIVSAFKGKRVEKPATETAISDADKQESGAPRADQPANKIEGDTANPDAGKGENKPIEKPKDNESVPLPVFKERLAKEKGRREKLETEVTAAKTEAAKMRHLFEVAVAENERITEQLRASGKLDERDEELQSLKLTQAVKEQLAKKDQEHQAALEALRQQAQTEAETEAREAQVKQLTASLAAEVKAACAAFPGASFAEVKDALRKNPQADIQAVARKLHDDRKKALLSQQSPGQVDTSSLPTTVGKPTGVSKFEAPLSAKGMSLEFKRSRGKR